MFCYQKRFFEPTLPVDEQTFRALVRDKESNALIDGFRQSGDAKLKRKLPAFIFQATFDETTSKSGKKGAWRKQAATRLTGLVVMDIDHVEHPREVIDAWMGNFDLEKWGILLIYVTPSGHGIKTVFKAHPQWGNLIDNQHRMAQLLGVQVDEACKDASRMSFICKEEDIVYLDKQLFTYENKEFAAKYDEEYRNGHSANTWNIEHGTLNIEHYHADGRAQPNNGQWSMVNGQWSMPNVQCSMFHVQCFKGIPYAAIIAEWWKLRGGEPAEGERNTELHRLAVHLRTICDNRAELLLQIMPRFGLSEQEMRSIIASATKDQPRGKTREIQAVLQSIEHSPLNIEHSPLNIDHYHADGTAQLNGQWSMVNYKNGARR